MVAKQAVCWQSCLGPPELMGADYGRRWTQVKERVLAMKRIWTEPEAEFHGGFVDFPPIKSDPKPVQKPHPPVHLGGHHPHSFKRVGEWADGWIPLCVTAEEVRAGREKIAQHARAAGRDPSKTEISVFGGAPTRDMLKAYEDAGVVRYVTFVESYGPGEMERQLSSLAATLRM